jgi:hypothetical protein
MDCVQGRAWHGIDAVAAREECLVRTIFRDLTMDCVQGRAWHGIDAVAAREECLVRTLRPDRNPRCRP